MILGCFGPLRLLAYSAASTENDFIALYVGISLLAALLSFLFLLWGESKFLALVLMGLNAFLIFPAIYILTAFATNGAYVPIVFIGLAGVYMPVYKLINKKGK